MSNEIIETRMLKRYFDKGKIKAVDEISFKVDGGIHGFLGPNGAGKSTTIKILVGAIRKTDGDAWIFGHKAGSVRANSRLGYLPEHPQFYDRMSLRDYLRYMGRLTGLSKAKTSTRALELVEWLGLEDAFDRNISDFSAGMKQKAGFAQALIHQPDLVILDEPTANLDAIGRSNILKNIKRLSDELDQTIFISSHVLSEIEKVADSVTIIDKGRIILDDDVATIKDVFSGNRYIIRSRRNDLVLDELRKRNLIHKLWAEEETYLELTPSDDELLKKELPKILVELDLMMDEFRRREISLEDIFMIAISEEVGKENA